MKDYKNVSQLYFLVPQETVLAEMDSDFLAEFSLLDEKYPDHKASGSIEDDPEKIFYCAIESVSPALKEQLELMLIAYALDNNWSLVWLQSAWNIVEVIENPGTDEEYITKIPFSYVVADMTVLGRFFRGDPNEVDGDGNVINYHPATVENCSVYQGFTKPTE